jgi:hypothetical protein
MDPVSTLILVASFLAPILPTKRPEWLEKSLAADYSQEVNTTSTTKLVSASPVLTASILLTQLPTAIFDRCTLLAQEIQTYKFLNDGWDGVGSVSACQKSIDAALYFVGKIPSGLPLPSAMLSYTGEVGLFWDAESGYADINFTSDGYSSFFSRTYNGQEYFQESLANASFTREWFFQVLGAVSAPNTQAA